jgi:diguanylate cyclase (GGDEF)-like protein
VREIAHYSEPTAVTVYFAIGAVCLALLTAVTAAVAVWRARATADARVADAVQSLAVGMQETMRDLAGALEESPAEARYVGLRGELAATLDLDDVTARILEAAATIPGVDGVRLEAEGPGGSEVSAAVGMAEDETGRASVAIPTDANLRAVEVFYRYRIEIAGEAASEATPRVRLAVAVPIRAEGRRVGTLSVFTRSAIPRIADEAIEELERLAFNAGPALDNARRYAEARALADLDALTGLHNRRYFHETLAREVARAVRYRRRLAVIVLDLDDFKAINDHIGHLAGDAVLAEAAERMLTVIRAADTLCRIGGDEFAVVLPEASVEDGELLAGRIAGAIAARPIGSAGTLQLSAGVAELRSNERPNDLFQRADDALYRAKELGKAQTVAVDGA